MSPEIAPVEAASAGERLRELAVSNLGYSGLWKALTWVCNASAAVVLARLLSPDDFGVYALAFLWVGWFSRVNELGLAAAVVKRQSDDPATLETAFTIRLGALLATGTILAGLAPLWAGYQGRPVLAPMIWCLLLPTVLTAFPFVPSVRLYRDYRHGRQGFARFSGEAAKALTAIAAAAAGAGAWAFVWGYAVQTLVTGACYIAFAPWKPRLRFDREAAAGLLGFGGVVLAANLLGYAAGNVVDRTIVGKVLGVAALGAYVQAYAYGSWASAEVAQLVSDAIYPGFARRQGDVLARQAAYRATLRATAAAVAPLAFGLAVAAPEFVRGVLGPKWEDSILPLRIFCAFGLILSFERVSEPVAYAGGRPRAVLAGQVAMLAVLVATLAPAVSLAGLPGAALACVLAALLATALVVRAVARALSVRGLEVLGEVRGPLLAAGAMAGVVLAARSLLVGRFGTLPLLGCEVATGAVAYFLAGRILMPGAQREILGEARGLLRRAFRVR